MKIDLGKYLKGASAQKEYEERFKSTGIENKNTHVIQMGKDGKYHEIEENSKEFER